MEYSSIVVPENTKGRIDKWLPTELSLSRAQIQQLIKAKLILVDGKVVNAHYPLVGGEKIDILGTEAAAAIPEADFKVIAEELDYLVIYKPVGVVAHPAPGSRAPVLTAALVKKYPELKEVGDPARPGLVHRLDRDVSGLMVVARTPAMYEYLKNQFQERRISKGYTGLVKGVIPDSEGVLNFTLGRSKRSGRMAARPAGDEEGREAITKFVATKKFAHHTLVSIELVTGRTHQIRAHFFAFGYPLVGDPLYRQRGYVKVKPGDLKRPFLEATYLAFQNLRGETKEYSVPLDQELLEYLDRI
jgi:23S rRNA pseudouridine1911/1915/1917 synthase